MPNPVVCVGWRGPGEAELNLGEVGIWVPEGFFGSRADVSGAALEI
jgi:hypothetical protein